jgi:hypothetical protein
MTVEQILELARNLSPAEQQQLFEGLQALTFAGSGAPTHHRYNTLLSIAGSAHSEYQDVSEDKLRHLGEAYADQ